MAVDNSQVTYSAQDIDIYYNILGVAPFHLQNFSEGDMFDFTRNVDMINPVVGVQGAVGIAVSANKSGNITISLLQDSETDKFLNNIVALQGAAGSNLAPATMLVNNPRAGTKLYATTVLIRTIPPYKLSSSYPTRDWVFFCGNMTIESIA